MTRRIAILRPEPGNASTTQRVRDAGLEALPLPLFTMRPLDWTPPDPARFDGLLLTSANALLHGGAGLAALRALPVLAVGPTTADAARAAGFDVTLTGDSDVATLLREATGDTRLLWLAGRERTAFDHPALAATIAAYASDAQTITAADATLLHDSVALVHSSRAARQLAAELDRHAIPRGTVRIAAISPKVVEAAGSGWGAIAAAATPDDDALIAAAHRLAIDP
ncbi:uroporphyrinogen-III synthase [Sphingomonas sp. LT1P40]|uniref:uroporphyrinogen-III synthase n=1 Tax=Alteristakelama amylovorans TaxID=3096166 RepID=UPI002FCC039E